MLMNKINYTISLLLLLCIISNGCKKFVTVESPQTQLSSSSIFNSDATAIAAQLSIYSQMELDGLAYNIMINSGMSADEFTNYSTSVGAIDLATNNLTPDNFVVQTIWTRFYNYIYQTNAILEGLKQATKISDSTKKQLEGESKFVRAFCHFYLVSIYGDIPIINSTDYLINESAERASVNSVYTFIENDLKDAILLLGSEYLNARNLVTTERVRPNKSTASALLSRVYLYIGKWSEAEIEASKVIDYKSRYSLATSLNNSFLKNNSEAIWQLFAVYPTYNSHPGAQLILRSTPTVVALDTNFVKSFRLSDNRKLSWIQSITVSGKTYYYPYKYKVGLNASTITEYTMVLRLSEQYLIRAEARAKLNNINGSLADLNQIRIRAGLTGLSGVSQTPLIDSIQIERKYELFSEFGDRWFNLRRTGSINQIMKNVKGNNWTDTDQLYPIPQSEINKNARLKQNPGY